MMKNRSRQTWTVKLIREWGFHAYRRCARRKTAFLFVLGCFFVGPSCSAQEAPSAGTVPFVFDGNRMYAELAFVRRNGSIHQALALVDMGSPSMTLADSLFRELQLDKGGALRFRVGELSVELPRKQVSSEAWEPYSVGSDLKVEAILPAGVLQKYLVVIDYRKRTLTLAQPGSPQPQGVAVPFVINHKTGLIAVKASINGESYLFTIDNGSAYTWLKKSVADSWLVLHPRWERGTGAVGPSNMMMSGDDTETSGTLLRIPELSLGSLVLNDVGALAVGPGHLLPGNLGLFDWYSQKNVEPVIGWIGGNVLKRYRLTIDYSNRRIYWEKQSEPDSHELDAVGLVLQAKHHQFIVSAVAIQDGRPAVVGVLPGDKLVRIDDLQTDNATWGAIYRAMHGRPGETRLLVLDRGGKRLTVATKVTAF
jgi:hypothetical protein